MSAFVLAALVVLAIALAFALAPLWRPARPAAIATAATLLVGSVLVYALVGHPQALRPSPEGDREPPASLEEAVDRLAMQLRAEPDQLEGWILLGRSRKTQERFDDAVRAFEEAARLAPGDPDVLVEHAEALVLASESRHVTGVALDKIQEALERDPEHQRGLLLLGIHHRQGGRPERAAEVWERLLGLIGPDARPAMLARVNEARTDAGLEPLAGPREPVQQHGTRLHVRIELNPLLRDQPVDGATLFVIARALDGGPAPVAVHRQPVTGFPVEVTLSDADAMLPTLTLSDLRAVRLDARVSLGGDAAPRPGDLEAEGVVVGVRDGHREVLVIERIVGSR